MKLVNTLAVLSLFASLLFASACVTGPGDGRTSTPPVAVQVPNSALVQDFIRNSATFKFDGMEGSIMLLKAEGTETDMELNVEFQTLHAGHGDRTGQALAQVITTHNAVIKVVNGQIISAVCDDAWDMLKDAPVKSGQPAVPASLGREFTLPVGQTAGLAGQDLTMKFVGVDTDSRAPKGVQALWAGEAKIRLEVTTRGSISPIILTEKGLTEGYTQASVSGYNVSFKLQPYPEAGYQPSPGEYKLLLTVSK